MPDEGAAPWYWRGEPVLALWPKAGWWRARVEAHTHQGSVRIRWDRGGSSEEVPEWRVCRELEVEAEDEPLGDESETAALSKSWWWTCWESLPVSPNNIETFCVHPHSSNNWTDDAVRIFRAYGFVVMKGALDARRCQPLLDACRRVEAEMLANYKGVPGKVPGLRGPGRWSFGGASRTGSMLHEPAWADLLTCEPLLELMNLIFPLGGACVSGGGDFVLGDNASGFQPLHSDLAGWPLGPFNVSFPPPYVCANFVVHEITADKGPMRIIPATQTLSAEHMRRQLDLPNFWDESEAWRCSNLCPLQAGDVIVRDVRVLHGGTPNTSASTRFLPSLNFALAQYLEWPGYDWPEVPNLPEQLCLQLPQLAQWWCRGIVAKGPLESGWL